MKYEPAKAQPSIEEMEAYERGYNMATAEAVPPATHFYPDDAVLLDAFMTGWHDKVTGALRNELMACLVNP